MTLITNPFQNDFALYEKYLRPDFVFENFTQSTPLPDFSKPGESDHRNINKARRAGCTVRFCEEAAMLLPWYRIHEKRHAEIGALPLDIKLFKNIVRELIPRQKASWLIAELDGKIISGCFYVHHRHVADVYMQSMDSEHSSISPNTLITDFSIRWFKERQFKIYNWQSSQNRFCGVYAYKQRWQSVDSPYYFVTKILGDMSPWKNLGAEEISHQYPWHYTVPLQAFTEGFDKKYYRKGD